MQTELIARKLKENIKELIEKGQLEAAETLVENYREVQPEDIEVYSIYGVIAILKGNLKYAEEILLEGLKRDNQNFDILYNLAYVYEVLGEYRQALKFYSEAELFCTDFFQIRDAIKDKIHHISSIHGIKLEELQNVEEREKYLQLRKLKNIINKSTAINNFFYTPPSLNKKLYRTNNENDVKELMTNYKIQVSGNLLNYIYIDPDFKNMAALNLSFIGQNNVVIIGKPMKDTCFLNLNAEFQKNNSTLVISDMHYTGTSLAIIFYDDNQMIVWGKGSTSNGTVITCQYPDSIIAVGDDCMFAAETWMRNSDMHGIYDLSTGRKINYYGNIILQPHVWVGQYAYLLGEVLVGYGSIIGAQSLVKGTLDSCSIYAGSPAKKIRENVSWDRNTGESISEETRRLLDLCKNRFDITR